VVLEKVGLILVGEGLVFNPGQFIAGVSFELPGDAGVFLYLLNTGYL